MRLSNLSALTNVNLIGLMGQSNANGIPFDVDHIDDGKPYPLQHGRHIFEPVSRTWQILQRDVNNHGGPNALTVGDGFGVEMRLMELLYNYYGTDQYMIKYASGGVPIAEDTGATYNWSPTSEDGFMFNSSVNNYWDAMNTFPANNINMKVVIWIQGESDGELSIDAGAYQSNFLKMAKEMMNQYNLPNLKFLNVLLGDKQTNIAPYKDAINQAKKNITINGSRIVSADGLATREGVHFTSDSYNTLAERIFEVLITML